MIFINIVKMSKILNTIKCHYLSIIFFIIFSIIRFLIISDINKNGFKLVNTILFISTSLLGFYNLYIHYKNNKERCHDIFNLFIEKIKKS